MTEPEIEIPSGRLRGMWIDGVERYLGIPYAAPPVGPRRFCPPQAATAWEGIRDARQPGPSAPYRLKDFPALDLIPLVGAGGVGDDHYLTVNVWTPGSKAESLPVMVFIHGGAFVGGSATASVQDGAAFARDGVVLMTVAYRVGVEGFLPIDGAPTNLGLRDMIAALTWVQVNAAAFGGNPANVTVFGESAGAMAIADLVVSPLASGLFRRAIIQSGHGSMVRSIPVTRRVTRAVANAMGVKPTLEGFRSASVEQALDAVETVSAPTARLNLRDEKGREPAYGLSRFLPVFGDDVIPVRPLEALAQGAGRDIDVLIGSNAEEMNLYFVPTGVRAKAGRLLSWLVLSRSIRKAGAILKAYGLGRRGKRPGDALTEAMSDLVFRWPARAYAATHQGRTHVYDFGWRSPACDGELGACHAVELPFVFDTLTTASGPKGILGEAPPQALANRVHRIWVDYARDGSLPWPEYDAVTRQVHRLDTGETALEAPMLAARFWP
ncbi:carboxylesterase/lipase family protein [Brevundimonas sp.]|uniref:carboxylesterase/lipase family protein n=1 Tax=Brevundimonas sp. TaxID=1871086 RepID=UPI0035B24E92